MADDRDAIVLHIVRKALHRHNNKSRTYGTYSLIINSAETARGFVCEPHGPDDNEHEDCGNRIRAKTYALCAHYGDYRSVGYNNAGRQPLPCIALGDFGKVGHRTSVLLHPGHSWGLGLYLSSIGCLNLTGPLDANQQMDAKDSFDRVVAVLDAIKTASPAAFVADRPRVIEHASIAIESQLEDAFAAI